MKLNEEVEESEVKVPRTPVQPEDVDEPKDEEMRDEGVKNVEEVVCEKMSDPDTTK
ncbi:hypothetical protein KI387_028780, partial [Taxus chinensis]